MKKAVTLCMSLLMIMGMAGCISDFVDPSTLETPQYSVDSGEAPSLAPGENEVHTAEDGIKLIPLPADSFTEEAEDYKSVTKVLSAVVTPENVWETDTVATYHAFTLPEKVSPNNANGSLGVLSIPTLGVTANVFETADEMEAMNHGIAHFRSTSAWDGTVGLSAHNINFNGTDGYFKNLHTLKIGDTVTYSTALGERDYKVTLVKSIRENDWSYLNRSAENKLTLITCISGKPTQRLVVQAVQR